MSTTEFKNVAEAAAELTRKATQNMTDISIKTWKDVMSFGDVVAKAQSEAVKGYTNGYGYQEIAAAFSKMQSDTLKTFTTWANGLTNQK